MQVGIDACVYMHARTRVQATISVPQSVSVCLSVCDMSVSVCHTMRVDVYLCVYCMRARVRKPSNEIDGREGDNGFHDFVARVAALGEGRLSE